MASPQRAALQIGFNAEVSNFSRNLRKVEKDVRNYEKNLQKGNRRIAQSVQKTSNKFNGIGSAATQAGGLVGGSAGRMVSSVQGVTATLATAKVAVKGFGTAGKIAIAGATAGVSLLIAAVVSVISYFTQFQGGIETVRTATNFLKILFIQLGDVLIGVGGGIVKFFTGDFAGGLEEIRKGFAKLDFKEAGTISARLTETQNLLERERVVLQQLRNSHQGRIKDIRLAIVALKAQADEEQRVNGNSNRARVLLARANKLRKEGIALSKELTAQATKTADLEIKSIREVERAGNTNLKEKLAIEEKIGALETEKREALRAQKALEAAGEEILSRQLLAEKGITAEKQKQVEIEQQQRAQRANLGATPASKTLTDSGVEGPNLGAEIEKLKQIGDDAAEGIGEVGTVVNDSLNNTIGLINKTTGTLSGALAGTFMGLGKTLADGGSVLDLGVGVLAGSLGSLGQAMIKTGIAKIPLDILFASGAGAAIPGPVLIAAGVALATFAGVLGNLKKSSAGANKSLGSTLNGGGSGGGGGGASIPTAATPSVATSSTPSITGLSSAHRVQPQRVEVEGKVRVDGVSLEVVLNASRERLRKSLGGLKGI